MFLIVGMSPRRSNYSRLSCFSKINKSFFHSFYCFCIPRKNSQGPQSPRRGPELQALAMLGVLGPTIRAKSDCGCARSLNSFWPPILRSQRPQKMFLCWCKKFKRGFKWLGFVENSVLLKCRKLRREDQETSDSIVGFFIEKSQCDGRLQSSKSLLSNFYRVSYRQNWRRDFYRLRQNIK